MPPQQLQISIPLTSLSDGDKPYTLYHVQLSLPIRIHETKKRYSDFATLHTDLTTQTGQAPPGSLPPKSWLRRTVGNASLTESRRQSLEAYLRAIVEADDPRWRSSSAWRTFLNLPTDSSTAKGQQRMGLPQGVVADPNEWLDLHRDVKTQIHNARQLLKKRDGAQTVQEQHAVSADAKAALVKAAVGIARLDDSLAALGRRKDEDDDGGWGSDSKLGEGEIRRRKDLLGASKKEIESLESTLRSLVVKSSGSMLNNTTAGATASKSDKEGLWRGTSVANGGGAHKSGRVLGGKETDRTRELDNSGVLQLQKQILGEQDQDVLEIGKSVSRMKEMGIMINEELVIQNQMLDLMGQDVDRVDSKIAVAKKKISKIS